MKKPCLDALVKLLKTKNSGKFWKAAEKLKQHYIQGNKAMNGLKQSHQKAQRLEDWEQHL